MKMLRDNVLIRVEKETQTKSGISLPVEVVENKVAAYGEAIVVGPKCKYVKKGDMVHYKNYVGNVLENDTLKDQDKYWYVVVSESDIVAIL